MRPCRRGALRQLHACQPPGCSVESGGAGGGIGVGRSLALELDGVLLGLPPESPSAEGLPAEEKKCRLWTACIIAAMFVFGAKFYLGPQKYRAPVQQSMHGEDNKTILANRTILEVVILGAMFCFVASLLLFGCLSLCRAHARVLLAAAVSSSQPQPPAPLAPLRPPLAGVPLASGAFSLPPPTPSHAVAPSALHEDSGLDTGTFMAFAASGHSGAGAVAFSDVPEVSVVPPEPPPPPYHVAITLPTQSDEVPPPPYDKAVS